MSHYGFDHFATELEHLVPRYNNQQELVGKIVPAMQKLLSNEQLLNNDFVKALIDGHGDGRVYTSPEHRFFVQVFAWPPGCNTPIHDHNTWGVMGVYHNQLKVTEFDAAYTDDPGRFDLQPKDQYIAERGMISVLTCPHDEVHHIENPSSDYSYSIHVYGDELNDTHSFDSETGRVV